MVDKLAKPKLFFEGRRNGIGVFRQVLQITPGHMNDLYAGKSFWQPAMGVVPIGGADRDEALMFRAGLGQSGGVA
jgi:hypothetical protein